MTGTVHEIRPRTLQQRQEAIAPILPIVPAIVDFAVQMERIRSITDSALSVLRACPASVEAQAETLNQIQYALHRANEARAALETLLQCEGQA